MKPSGQTTTATPALLVATVLLTILAIAAVKMDGSEDPRLMPLWVVTTLSRLTPATALMLRSRPSPTALPSALI